jgi:hypothetical protein
MIFRQYILYSNGSFHCEGSTRLVRGEFNFMMLAEEFLQDVGMDYFPTIQIEESDNIHDQSFRNCLLKMFFVRQIRFFILNGWKVHVVDRDVEGCDIETFGLSVPQDLRHAQEIGISHEFTLNDFMLPHTTLRLVNHYLCNLGSKNFWIERWNDFCLVVHVTRKKVERRDVICVKG